MRNPFLPCLLAICLTLAACARPVTAPPGDRPGSAELTSRYYVTEDGLALPLRRWRPRQDQPHRAVILALHGFNDYSGAFREVGPTFAAAGHDFYAYDQRSFGGAPNRGVWPGADRLAEDVRLAAAELRQRHSDRPLYLLGLSMGGAVAMTVLAEHPEAADGAVLIGPAVRGRDSLPAYQRWALDASVALFPGLRATGEGLRIRPTDNIEALRRMARDPNVIKATRIDALHGLVELMGRAQDAAARQAQPLLFLYGIKDDLVPKRPTIKALRALPTETPRRIAVYDDGHHMLLRDLKRDRAIADILAWIADPATRLPSGADRRAIERLAAAAE